MAKIRKNRERGEGKHRGYLQVTQHKWKIRHNLKENRLSDQVRKKSCGHDRS